MRFLLILIGIILPLCHGYQFYGDADYWYRCSDPAHTEMWITCNLRLEIIENVKNATKLITENVISELSERLDRQDRMLKRLLSHEEANSEVEKPIDCSAHSKDIKDDDARLKIIYPVRCDQPLRVYCMKRSGHPASTVILKRDSKKEMSFERNYTEYKNNFGSVSENFWIGLDNLHYLTKDKDVDLMIFGKDFNGAYADGKWNQVEILDEDNGYELHIGEYSSESRVKDALSSLNGQKFSTFDNDNDKSSGNCAEEGKGGWWYSDCGLANPTGPPGDTKDIKSFFWTGWASDEPVTLTRLEMILQPKKDVPKFRKCYGKDGLLEPFDYS